MLKDFIHKYIDLIDKCQFDELYTKAAWELSGSETGKLTSILLSIGVDPMNHYAKELKYKIPYFYMAGMTPHSDVHIPEGYTDIGTGAFKGTNVDKIFLPESLEMIGNSCFSRIGGTMKVILPKKIPTLENANSISKYSVELYYFGTKEELAEQI